MPKVTGREDVGQVSAATSHPSPGPQAPEEEDERHRKGKK